MATQGFEHQPVHTVLAVAKGLVVPNYVRRDPESGAWVALPSRAQAKQLVVTSWEQLLQEDGNLASLRSLQPGQAAERSDPSGRWELLPEAVPEERHPPSHGDCYEQSLRVSSHADLLMAYLVIAGVGALVIAGFAFMLLGRIPTPHEHPLTLGAQLHTWWWQLIGLGVVGLVCGIVAGARQSGWPGLVAGATCAGLGLWIWDRLGGLWLPVPVALCGLGAILAWRGTALLGSRWRLQRLERARGA